MPKIDFGSGEDGHVAAAHTNASSLSSDPHLHESAPIDSQDELPAAKRARGLSGAIAPVSDHDAHEEREEQHEVNAVAAAPKPHEAPARTLAARKALIARRTTEADADAPPSAATHTPPSAAAPAATAAPVHTATATVAPTAATAAPSHTGTPAVASTTTPAPLAAAAPSNGAAAEAAAPERGVRWIAKQALHRGMAWHCPLTVRGTAAARPGTPRTRRRERCVRLLSASPRQVR